VAVLYLIVDPEVTRPKSRHQVPAPRSYISTNRVDVRVRQIDSYCHQYQSSADLLGPRSEYQIQHRVIESTARCKA